MLKAGPLLARSYMRLDFVMTIRASAVIAGTYIPRAYLARNAQHALRAPAAICHASASAPRGNGVVEQPGSSRSGISNNVDRSRTKAFSTFALLVWPGRPTRPRRDFAQLTNSVSPDCSRFQLRNARAWNSLNAKVGKGCGEAPWRLIRASGIENVSHLGCRLVPRSRNIAAMEPPRRRGRHKSAGVFPAIVSLSVSRLAFEIEIVQVEQAPEFGHRVHVAIDP